MTIIFLADEEEEKKEIFQKPFHIKKISKMVIKYL